MSTTCPNCHRCIADGSLFCGACGGKLVSSPDVRTVAMSAGAVPYPAVSRATLTAAQRQTVTTRMAKFGGATVAMPIAGMHQNSSQREHVFLLIDVSGSMGAYFQGAVTKREAATRAAQALLQHKDPNDEIGIIAFDDRAKLLLPLRPLHLCRQQAMAVLEQVPDGGGTDIPAGLKLASKSFNYHQQGVVRRVVLLTDGYGGDPRGIAADMKSRGVVIDTVGVGAAAQRDDVDEPLLKEIASTIQGQNRYRFLSSLDQLVGHYTILSGKTAVC